MNRCKRQTVVAVGRNSEKLVSATNGNVNECSGEVGNCGCTHAEMLVLRAMPNPQNVLVTLSPCIDCAKALVESGVRVVEYENEYRKTDGIEYLVKNGVSVEKI